MPGRLGSPTIPYLEYYAEAGGPPERVPVLKIPFTIGRSEATDHRVYSSKVSKEHAAILRVGDRYAVRDLDSTNGTFVNGTRTMEHVLSDGDIIHVAHKEFCFRHKPVPINDGASSGETEKTQEVATSSPGSLIRGTELLRELLAREAVEILYQPIVDFETRTIAGYEALGRGAHPSLSRSPAMLMQLAEQCGMAVELSELFSRAALARSTRLPAASKIFVNVHADEVHRATFLESLAAVRAKVAADHPVVVEIAESAVTNITIMAKIKEAIVSKGFEFAYDDFGVGQARFLELVELPPHYLKLDITVIQGIEAAEPRRAALAALLHVVGTLGTRVIAEGIETRQVAEMCRQIGCHLGQGHLLGEPM